jgi:hypothetical protein
MKRKSYTGPFWMMLIIAIISAVYNYGAARIILKMTHLRLMTFVLLFLWPMLLFAESIVYWMVRKRIVYRKYAWAHIFFTFLNFIIFPLIRALTVGFAARFPSFTVLHEAKRVEQEMQFSFFWSLIILGHVFFGMALKKSFTKDPVLKEDPENINLLDDVLN